MEHAVCKALVVDDNPISLRVMERLITGFEIKVVTASGGPDALEKIASREFDIVFMDYMMPGMDGIQVLHSIREMQGEYFQKVPVIALTGTETAGARECFLAEGFQDFMEKPPVSAKLEGILNQFLSQRKSLWVEDASEIGESAMRTIVDWEQILAADGLDVKTGLLFCNDKETYLNILGEYCRIEETTENDLNQALDNRDWENYTIFVHGIKSAMRSVGATELSDAAKQLESASREGRISYIFEHHEGFLKQYKELFTRLKANPLFCTADTGLQEEAAVPLKDLTEEAFSRMIEDMENAVYAFELDYFTKAVMELEQYRYKGEPLKELATLLQRKVQRADYISAVGVMKQWKRR